MDSNKLKASALIGLILLGLVGVVYAAGYTESEGMTSAREAICGILYNIRTLLYFIAGGIAAVVITLQGIKWASSAEDPGARKQAKEGIIHAVVGLIIVMVAVWIVLMVIGGSQCGL